MSGKITKTSAFSVFVKHRLKWRRWLVLIYSHSLGPAAAYDRSGKAV